MYKRILLMAAVLVHLVGTHYPVYEPHLSFSHVDKVLHFSIFFILMLLWRLNWPHMPLVWTMLLTGVYAACDELTQLLAVGRSAELADWAADMLGAVLAFYVYEHFRGKRKVISLTNG